MALRASFLVNCQRSSALWSKSEPDAGVISKAVTAPINAPQTAPAMKLIALFIDSIPSPGLGRTIVIPDNSLDYNPTTFVCPLCKQLYADDANKRN